MCVKKFVSGQAGNWVLQTGPVWKWCRLQFWLQLLWRWDLCLKARLEVSWIIRSSPSRMRNFNFFSGLRSRRGSQIVESAMVLPLTVLILAALVGLLMTFYITLTEQIKTHEQEREKLYEQNEVHVLRMKDNLNAAGEALS